MQIECLRAQVDALMATVVSQDQHAAPVVDPAETCPCGASGETQQAVPRISDLPGVRRVFCTSCKQERTV